MIAETSPITEVVVKIMPEQSSPSPEAEAADDKRESNVSYQVLVYADPRSMQTQADFNPPKDQTDKIGELRLSAVERVTIDWEYYRGYLRSFVTRGEKGAERLDRRKLFESISPGLEELLKGRSIDKRPLRVWWQTTTPSLDELPWEMLAYGDDDLIDDEVSFVRGTPPGRPVPVLPVGQKLRLALIHESSSASQELVDALKDLPNLEVVSLTEPPLQALQLVINKGFELVHMVAEASATLAYEGFLYLRKPQIVDITSDAHNGLSRHAMRLMLSSYNLFSPMLPKSLSVWLSGKLYRKLDVEILSTSELSALQRGSPLAVLGLSAPKSAVGDLGRVDALLLPSIFRAFACIGNSPLPMPNIVAQIGEIDERRVLEFWRHFYGALCETLQVEQAMRKARKESSLLTMALFLRQQHSQTFSHSEMPTDIVVTQINAELAESEETMEELRELGSRFSGLSEVLEKFGRGESARQEQLKSRLQEWLPEQRGESDEPGHKD